MVAAPDLGSGGESRGGSSPPIRTSIQNSEFRIMNNMDETFSENSLFMDQVCQRSDTLKDVVCIQIDENQQVISFSRVGREKIKKAVPALIIMAVAIASGCLHLTVGKIIVAMVIVALVCWSLVDVFSVVTVDIKRKKLSIELFNITLNEFSMQEYRGALVYNLSLNGRQPTPKEFCVKFRHNGKRKEIHLADLLSETENASRENLAHVAEIWKSVVALMQITEYETEYQMSARNAIFS